MKQGETLGWAISMGIYILSSFIEINPYWEFRAANSNFSGISSGLIGKLQITSVAFYGCTLKGERNLLEI